MPMAGSKQSAAFIDWFVFLRLIQMLNVTQVFQVYGVYPFIDDDIDIEILDKDLKVDTYRASGAGGQHVNTTDSAVRITHIPTKIVVQCQNQRSQHKNRATAMTMLKARLFERELQIREAVADAENANKTDNSWGASNPLICTSAISNG